MRFLFVTCDGGGNLPPELALARRLTERGHEVRFLGHRSQQAAVDEAGFEFRVYGRAPDWDYTRPDAAPVRDWELTPFKMLAELRDKVFFGPAAAFAADVLAELDRQPTDAVVVDFFLFGAAAAAESSGLPSAALWHTIYSRDDYPTPAFGPGFGLARGWPGRLRDRAVRTLDASLLNKGLAALNGARAGIGLDPLRRVDEQLDRLDRVLVMTSPAFDFAALSGAPLPSNVRYVGPQVELGPSGRSSRAASSSGPLVLVSFSTIYQAQEPLLRKIVAGLAMLPVRALVTTGPAVELDGALPTNVEVSRWVPHAEVLPAAALVVTHAGMGTVMTSLAHGVPVLCLPMGRDQLDVAARVLHAGAGMRLSAKAGERKIAAAVRQALADRALGANARRLAEAIRKEIGADHAVAELEALGSGRDSSKKDSEPTRMEAHGHE